MKAGKSRFQAEVRFGLLAVIFLLLFLTFASNFLIFSTRSRRHDVTTARLRTAAGEAARLASVAADHTLSGREQSALMRTYQIDQLYLVPYSLTEDSPAERRRWFTNIADSLPVEEIATLANLLLGSPEEELQRGEGASYYYVHRAPVNDQEYLIITGTMDHELAHLDDINRLALIMTAIGVGTTVIVYLILSHIIFLPFRRLRREVEEAGHAVGPENDDVDAMIVEYRRAIAELQAKERQLIVLNEAVQRKADSLEQFNRYLLQSMRSGVITVDREGTIKMINEAACALLHLDSTATVGRPYTEVLPPQSHLREAFRVTLETTETFEYRELTHDLDRQTLNLAVSASNIKDFAGERIGVSLLIHDVTEITHLRAQLQTSERLAALGEMAGGLAHQLRNSMGAIGGYITLLKKRLHKRGIEEDCLFELRDETVEAEHLVNRFLEFARPLQLNPETVALPEFMADISASYQVREHQPSVRFTFAPAPEIDIRIDPLLLKQALSNLIDNAANACGDRPGEVDIEVSVTDDDIVFEIRDTGEGIDPDNLNKIFTPFYSSRPSGNGLGLPLVNKIVDLHQGRIEVDSTPDRGTVFTVILPLHVPGSVPPGLSRTPV